MPREVTEQEFRSATWDERAGAGRDRANEVRARNPKLVLWGEEAAARQGLLRRCLPQGPRLLEAGTRRLLLRHRVSGDGVRDRDCTVVRNTRLRSRQLPDLLGLEHHQRRRNKFCWLTWNQQLAKGSRSRPQGGAHRPRAARRRSHSRTCGSPRFLRHRSGAGPGAVSAADREGLSRRAVSLDFHRRAAPCGRGRQVLA